MRETLDRSADRDPGTLGALQAFDPKNCAAKIYGTVWLHLACSVKVAASGCMQCSYKHNAQVPVGTKKELTLQHGWNAMDQCLLAETSC
jgi:hypothetical protein